MRVPGRLSDAKLRALAPRDRPYKVADGLGLFVLVEPSGSRLWRLAYRFDGRQKLLSLGRYPEVSLAEARRRALELRSHLAAGRDPSAVRKAEKVAKGRTFAAAAEAWFEASSPRWSPAHRETVRYRLDRYVLSALGTRPLARIAPADIRELLRTLADRPETARRALQFVRAVFRHAIAHGLAELDPSASIARELLPARATNHRAAPTNDRRRLADLIRAIRAYPGSPIVRVALEVALLTAARPGEVRGMEWRELDLAAGEWRIPAERTKMREPHLVFLAPRAVALLEQLRPLTGTGPRVFPSLRSRDRPISENTLNAALRTMGFGREEATAHGFRSLFSTIANEAGADPDVVERCLGHAPRDAVRAAYHRAAYLGERRALAAWWADWLAALADGRPLPPLPDNCR